MVGRATNRFFKAKPLCFPSFLFSSFFLSFQPILFSTKSTKYKAPFNSSLTSLKTKIPSLNNSKPLCPPIKGHFSHITQIPTNSSSVPNNFPLATQYLINHQYTLLIKYINPNSHLNSPGLTQAGYRFPL